MALTNMAARRLLFLIAVCVLPLVNGCATTSGGFTIFPRGHTMLNTTEDVRVLPPPTLPLPRELEKTVLPAYIIEPGDELFVEPTSLESPLRFPSDQLVLPDGTIDLGAYGRLLVAGQTLEEIENLVRQRVAAEDNVPVRNVDVNVRLINPNSKMFYVLGEVNAPGAYPFVGRETVLDAILVAGGLTQSADPCQVVLARPTPPTGCRVVLAVCYNELVQLGDTTTNYQIMPGDRIYVATLPWWAGLIPGAGKHGCSLCRGAQVPCGDPFCFDPLPAYSVPTFAAPDHAVPLPAAESLSVPIGDR